MKDLPDEIQADAEGLYYESKSAGLLQGRSNDWFDAAAVYAACRIHGHPRSRNEIAAATDVSTQQLGNAFDAMTHELDVSVPQYHPTDFITRYADQLRLSDDVTHEAEQLAHNWYDSGATGGRSPRIIAAACIYRASDMSQVDVAEFADTHPMSIRSCLDAVG
jgi:transcription initiation factor TFIIB